MKTSLNSKSSNSYSLQEVLQQLIVQGVNNGIKRKTVESGGVPIGDLTDIQKKCDSGIVTSVNVDNGLSCVVKLESGKNISVDLTSDFRCIIPSINSRVTIDYDGDGVSYIQNCETVDNYSISSKDITLISNQGTINLDAAGDDINIKSTNTILLRTGSSDYASEGYGGLIKINELTTKLNNLVNEINSLKKYVLTHQHPTATSPPSTPFTGTFTRFNKSDYENETIRHERV